MSTIFFVKYPKHLILDLSTPQNYKSQVVRWEDEYSSNSLQHIFQHTTSNPLKSLSIRSSTSNSTNWNAPNSLDKIENSLTHSLFDINFLRKEKLYTKLKYSRCPQYDIISGGFAALLAGFIGFLISEKFGIELVDSGDFYIAMMYGVFGVLSARPLLRVYSRDNTPYTPLSLKYLYLFLSDLFTLTTRLVLKAFYEAKLYLKTLL